ncbi:MAG: FAD-binding protein [Cyclobacteriaceae bacterium]|nr:FAD-binding protein [Cyclobacteriaceae bacterium]
MRRTLELVLTPEEAFDEARFYQVIAEKAKLSPDEGFRLVKRSIDARSRDVVVRLAGEVVSKEEAENQVSYRRPVAEVTRGKRVLIIGAGPAGLFAALKLLEAGMKPVIIERGKDVQARRRDIAAINKAHVVNPDSNYCFGEGGAGTYSDGKLYTRSSKRGDVKRILEILVAHGAKSDILIDAHPHIGTNKLPMVIREIRETILSCGGEIHFETRVTDIEVRQGRFQAVLTTGEKRFEAEACILATGHSARDIFELLHRRQVTVEAKPFALGVRVEHQQQLIDRIQYHCAGERNPFLPAASYSLVSQVGSAGKERGVFSFCMCPGGFIVPAATAPGEVVVNGMSPSRRDSKYANSGIVVAVGLEDLKGYEQYGPLSGLHFQMEIEQKACLVAGGTQTAPAQRLQDFVDGKNSATLLDCSYQPGLQSCDVGDLFPSFITQGLRKGFRSFGQKMKGYLTNEAQVVGVESRTSSPVRIPRNPDTLEHPNVERLFPCGEGAGYAGGIVSAAMDGERCAEAIIRKYGRA